MNLAFIDLSKLLSKKELKNFIKECLRQESIEYFIDTIFNEYHQDYMYILTSSFIFDRSEMGYTYWNNIVQKLRHEKNKKTK